MKERYLKRGSSVRLERSGRVETIVRVRESGVAEFDGAHFRCLPILSPDEPADLPATEGIESLSALVVSAAGGPARIERLAVAAGSSLHFIEGAFGKRKWLEESARVHVSLVDPSRRIRIAIDLGAAQPDRIDLRALEDVAAALDLPEPDVPLHEDRVQLSPIVAAHLWLTIALHHIGFGGGNLVIRQSTHPEQPFDGRGARIRPRIIGRHAAHWATDLPNVFRPSYRVAPARLPFHVSAESAARRTPRPKVRAVALLSAFEIGKRSLAAMVLVTDGRHATAARLAIPRESLGACVISIARGRTWFPLAAGAWGNSTVLAGIELR